MAAAAGLCSPQLPYCFSAVCRVSLLRLLVIAASYLGSHLVRSNSISAVQFLPGFNGPLPFKLETGYVGVGEGEDVQLFYYFFESKNNPDEDPLLLWLTGGPGCSAISAIFYENGPIQFEEVKFNGSLPRLKLRPHSWTEVVSIIYIDMPVGTGFSYGRTPLAKHSSDVIASYHADEFLRKWLQDHPKFQSNSVYLGGESYSGMTLPVYFYQMSKGNEEGLEPFINLKGYLLGNPITNHTIEGSYLVPFVHGLGLISDELYESLVTSCRGNYDYTPSSSVNCLDSINALQECIAGVQAFHVLEPLCGSASPLPHELLAGARRSLYKSKENPVKPMPWPPRPSLGDFACRADGYTLAAVWFNDKHVQEALGVREGTAELWTRCNFGLNYTRDIPSSVVYHLKLSSKGYRSLIYSGDHDMVVPFLATQAWIRSLNFSIVEDWRSWHVNGQVAGYTRTYSNGMTFATVKGAGHTAPAYKPEECAAMFKRWLFGQPL
ncbi:hypothetical protein Dimus_027970 [Dionaea muscipula]